MGYLGTVAPFSFVSSNVSNKRKEEQDQEEEQEDNKKKKEKQGERGDGR